MERFLLISGRIISLIFAAVGVLLLVLMLAGILFVNASAVVPAFGENLVTEHVIDDVPQAVWQTFTDALPTEVTIRETTLDTAPLIDAFERSFQDILASRTPLGEWLQARIERVFTNLVTEVRGSAQRLAQNRVQGLQDALTGSAAEPLVNLLLISLQACTDAQVTQIQQVLGASPAPGPTVALSFVCRPPENLGPSALALMRNTVVLALAEFAGRAAGRIEERIQALELTWPTIDTPLGPATIEWPNIRVGTGRLSVAVPLPDSIVEPVQRIADDVRAQLGFRVVSATQEVQDAQATLTAIAGSLATEVSTRTPPTGAPTPAPTNTPTPVPTLSPDQIQAQRDAVGPVEQRILDLSQSLGDSLAQAASQITTVLLLIFGLPLLIHGYLQLYLMRRMRWWLLWIGLVMLLSGVILFVIQNALTTSLSAPLDNPLDPSLAAPLASVGASVRQALQDALQATLIGPFQTAALLLVLLGIVLLAVVVYLFWRARQRPPVDPDAPAAEPPAPTAPPPAAEPDPANPPAPATLDDEQPFPPSP